MIILNSQLSILNSQNVIRPKIACPNDIYVNSYNGVLFYQRVDLSIPNRSMPLEAVFYYNSSSNKINYGYGNGWSLGCEYRYNLDSMGVVIERGDGRKDLYLANDSSGSLMQYEPPRGVFHKLNYQMVVIDNAEHHLFTLTDKDGTVYYFDDPVSKRVTQIKDRNNNVLNFSYTDGRLATISDGNGRSLILTWTDSLLTALGTNVGDRTWHYAYDTLGNLVSVTNPMGYTVHYGYNRDNRISRFTDEAGYSTLITYNDDGMAHRIKTDLTDKSIRYEQASRQTVIVDYLSLTPDPSPSGEGSSHNQFTTYRWDTLGRVIEKTGNCCGYTSKLEYDEDNNVIRDEDANGNVITYTYDTNGNMLTRTDPMGYTDYYTYELTNNNILTHTDKLGNQYSFSYDNNGNLTSLNGPMESTEQFTYDSHGQLLTHTDALGHTTTYTYDQQGNLISTTNPLGNSVTSQYNYMGDITAITTSTGAHQQYVYDNMQRPTTLIDPLGSRLSLQYDSRGNVLAMTDPLNHIVHTSYDALNHPISYIDACQANFLVSYDANGNIVQTEDPLHHAVRMAYNDRNQVILAVDALGDSTHYEYDAVGNIIMATLPNGRQIVYTYDANSRLVQVEDQYGIIQKTQYDAMGRTIATINANGDTTRMTYDALGRLTSTQILNSQLSILNSYTYDLVGHLLTHTDANGNTTYYTYDAIGQLISERDAMDNVTTYAYNADGELTSVTDANGNATHYQYDAAGQLTMITFANGKTQQFWYDAVGNVIRHKDEAGNQTVMAYDANGNMVSRTYPDGSSDQYTYDLLGNMLTANNANANITFTYDANSQVLSETMTTPGTADVPVRTDYAYNTRQGKINITYPSGRTIEEHYDLRGRLTTILNSQLSTLNSPISSFTYTPTDYLASRTYANGDQTTFTYDPAGKLTTISALNSQLSILNLRYTYDPAGNILSRLDSLRPDHSETYSYDALHRLTEFRRGVANNSGVIPNPLKQVQYTLDALGNRLGTRTSSSAGSDIVVSYSHNNMNAYTTVGNETMQYNGNGNMLGDGRHTYQYNYRNRMISVDNGTTATYQYDALDRRIRKNTATDTIHYYYRGVQCIEELHFPSMREGWTEAGVGESGWISYVYGNAIDDILSMRRNGQDFYYLKNHLGSVMVITDSEGDIVETYDYDPYGTPTIRNAEGSEIAASTIGNTIMFTGREYDYETSLYYFRARSMIPTFGRFLQHDPLLYVDGINYYSYGRNNPLSLVDYFGTSSIDCQKRCNVPPALSTTSEYMETASDVYDKVHKPFEIYETVTREISVSSEGTYYIRKLGKHRARGGKNHIFYFENSVQWKKIDHFIQERTITKNFDNVMTKYTKITLGITLITNVYNDYCNGRVSANTIRNVADIAFISNVYYNTFMLGWDIGQWMNRHGWTDWIFKKTRLNRVFDWIADETREWGWVD